MRTCTVVRAMATIATIAAITVGLAERTGPASADQTPSAAAAFQRQLREHPFLSDASGAFSRTIFETHDDPDFNITIRDFSFPPDGRPHVVTLRSSAVLSLLSGFGDIVVDDKPQSFTNDSRVTVPANASVQVVDTSEQPVVLRATIVEAK
jgi:mannose-6-phosphate isomerase-like protein (cupin superfamily)